MKRIVLALAALVLTGPVFAGNSQDEKALKKSVADFQAAWDNRDAKASASDFAENGDLITPMGVSARGRAEVEKAIAADMAHFLGAGKSTFKVVQIRFLRPDIAVLDIVHTVIGSKSPDGKVMPEAKVLLTVVAAKTEGKWVWEAARPMIPFAPPSVGMVPSSK